MRRFCCGAPHKIVSDETSDGRIVTGDTGRHTRLKVVRRASGADAEREFEKLYRESYGLVYGYVRAQMADDAAAEDVVAEAYLKAARAFDRFDPTLSKFSTWMVTIARNCMVSHYRRERPTTTLDVVPQSVAAVEGEQGAVEDRDLVERLLAVLDDDERDLVLLKYLMGMRSVDIANERDMNASTVSTMLSRAIAKMRAVAEGST